MLIKNFSTRFQRLFDLFDELVNFGMLCIMVLAAFSPTAILIVTVTILDVLVVGAVVSRVALVLWTVFVSAVRLIVTAVLLIWRNGVAAFVIGAGLADKFTGTSVSLNGAILSSGPLTVAVTCLCSLGDIAKAEDG